MSNNSSKTPAEIARDLAPMFAAAGSQPQPPDLPSTPAVTPAYAINPQTQSQAGSSDRAREAEPKIMPQPARNPTDAFADEVKVREVIAEGLQAMDGLKAECSALMAKAHDSSHRAEFYAEDAKERIGIHLKSIPAVVDTATQAAIDRHVSQLIRSARDETLSSVTRETGERKAADNCLNGMYESNRDAISSLRSDFEGVMRVLRIIFYVVAGLVAASAVGFGLW